LKQKKPQRPMEKGRAGERESRSVMGTYNVPMPTGPREGGIEIAAL
jgi:hypothetical protein